MTYRPPLIWVAVLLAVGCGDALVDANYRGRVLLTFNGPLLMPEGNAFINDSLCYQEDEICAVTAAAGCGVNLEEFTEDAECPPLLDCLNELTRCLEGGAITDLVTESDAILRLSLFWAPNETVSESVYESEGVEQQSVSTASLPARYTLTLYRPPPKSALHAGATGHYAMAVVVAYYDTDSDGRFDPVVEPLLGGTPEHAILYSPDGVEDAELGTWGPGYHVITVADCNPAETTIRYQRAEDAHIPVRLSGSAPFSRDLLPGGRCEDDPGWWDEICTDALYWQCAQGHQDQAQCSFCGFEFYEDDGDAPPTDLDDDAGPVEPTPDASGAEPALPGDDAGMSPDAGM